MPRAVSGGAVHPSRVMLGCRYRLKLAPAIAPFTGSGGTAEAFVADPGEVISPTTLVRAGQSPPGSLSATPSTLMRFWQLRQRHR
jgi:hypothetical protein